jgi:hypothetical protein
MGSLGWWIGTKDDLVILEDVFEGRRCGKVDPDNPIICDLKNHQAGFIL